MISIHEFTKVLLAQCMVFTNSKSINFSDHQVIEAWHNHLGKYTREELISSFNKLLSKVDFFPSIAQIIKNIDPKLDIKDEAKEIEDKIMYAVSCYGYTQPSKAQEFIGDVGWNVIKINGGWSNICEMEDWQVDNKRKSFNASAKVLLENNKSLHNDYKKIDSTGPNLKLLSSLGLTNLQEKPCQNSIKRPSTILREFMSHDIDLKRATM